MGCVIEYVYISWMCYIDRLVGAGSPPTPTPTPTPAPQPRQRSQVGALLHLRMLLKLLTIAWPRFSS